MTLASSSQAGLASFIGKVPLGMIVEAETSWIDELSDEEWESYRISHAPDEAGYYNEPPDHWDAPDEHDERL